jgi:transcriptional regulator with XRE-family HTH domain
MISLKSVLAFNMKAQRHILKITQAQLAERVNTSTNYIALIESERNFPSLPMLERIAVALEIEPPALFSTKAYPPPEFGTLAVFQKKIISNVSEAISVSFKQFEGELPENPDPNGDTGHTIV